MSPVWGRPPALYSGTVNFSSPSNPSAFASIVRLPLLLASIRHTNDRIAPRRVPVSPPRKLSVIRRPAKCANVRWRSGRQNRWPAPGTTGQVRDVPLRPAWYAPV